MRGGVLFVENKDSFSWNVIDLLPVPRARVQVCGACEVRRDPSILARASMVVIGPGPRDPERAGLVELVREAARRRKPLLGVCLGHQALGLAFGARLARSLPAHGETARAIFSLSRLFAGVRGPVTVMRYHSLSLRGVRAPLRTVAALGDGTVMAVEHEALPMAGVQFHPDSFATPGGREMLAAFFRAAAGGA